MENLFDLIEVRFGTELIHARPFDFEADEKGDLVKALKASTSCPFCGHGNEVDLSSWHGGTISVKCVNCGAGDEDFSEPEYSIDANSDTVYVDRKTEQAILEALEGVGSNDGIDISKNNNSITIDSSEEVETLKSGCPFVDPIQLGIYTLDEV